MTITTKSGRRVNVVFVHSAHDGKIHDAPSGSFRQIVDHLARSRRRRVTLAVVREALADGPMETLAYGEATCHWRDQFSKLAGRAVSLERALKTATELPTKPFTMSDVNDVFDYYENEDEYLNKLAAENEY